MSSFRNRDRLRQEARFISLYPSLNYKYNYSLLYKTGLSLEMYRFNPLPAPGIVVGAVHGHRGTRAAARGAPGAAW